MGTWEVAAVDLVEKSAAISSTKKTDLDRAEQVSVSPAILGHSSLCCPLDSASFWGDWRQMSCLLPGEAQGHTDRQRGSTGTHGQLALGTPGGMMFISYMVRGLRDAPRCWLLEVGVSRAVTHGW